MHVLPLIISLNLATSCQAGLTPFLGPSKTTFKPLSFFWLFLSFQARGSYLWTKLPCLPPWASVDISKYLNKWKKKKKENLKRSSGLGIVDSNWHLTDFLVCNNFNQLFFRTIFDFIKHKSTKFILGFRLCKTIYEK